MQTSNELLKKYSNSEKDIVIDGADFFSQRGYTLLPNYVLHTKKLKADSKLVYAMLLSYAWGEKNKSFPGQERLAKDCGISLRSVSTAIKELKKEQFITSLRRGFTKTNIYILHFKRRKMSRR